MLHIPFIKTLDHKPGAERMRLIIAWLEKQGVPYRTHNYGSGANIIVDLGAGARRIGIASHFDIAKGSGGANDNGSAIAVCLSIIEKYGQLQGPGPALRIFFFDEEENSMKGSEAYVEEYGIDDMQALINMELVGRGNEYVLWPLQEDTEEPVLRNFERALLDAGSDGIRFSSIHTNSSDHEPFRYEGLEDAFTVTCVTGEDIKIAEAYVKANNENATFPELEKLLRSAPLFEHYHRPTDTYDTLDEKSLQRTVGILWETVMRPV